MSAGRLAILLMGDTLNFGGTEGQFVEVACRLDRSRWDVHVTCLRAEGPLRARLENAGIRAWSCGRGSFKSPRFLVALWGLSGSSEHTGSAWFIPSTSTATPSVFLRRASPGCQQ